MQSLSQWQPVSWKDIISFGESIWHIRHLVAQMVWAHAVTDISLFFLFIFFIFLFTSVQRCPQSVSMCYGSRGESWEHWGQRLRVWHGIETEMEEYTWAAGRLYLIFLSEALKMFWKIKYSAYKTEISAIFLLTTLLMEAPVTFSNPHSCSGLSQSKRIPLNANIMEAQGDHVKRRDVQQHHMCPYSSCGAQQASGRLSSPICLETATWTPCF